MKAKAPRASARPAQLEALLHQRQTATPAGRARLDRDAQALFAPRAVVFTDTSDFTHRVERDGVLHFLMLFQAAGEACEQAAAGHGGRCVKWEADSLLLVFPDVPAACAGVRAIEHALRAWAATQPARDRLRFSYGIGWGDVIDLGGDVFGAEVNLASKLGEDTARPDEALLTPQAARAARAAGIKLEPGGLFVAGARRRRCKRLPIGWLAAE
ncbi:MAG: hypothetical protein NDJ94_07780 [Vicinamibacteria bacterium]|nr:hypothetical protein [Vicinamibacteria bacterium]